MSASIPWLGPDDGDQLSNRVFNENMANVESRLARLRRRKWFYFPVTVRFGRRTAAHTHTLVFGSGTGEYEIVYAELQVEAVTGDNEGELTLSLNGSEVASVTPDIGAYTAAGNRLALEIGDTSGDLTITVSAPPAGTTGFVTVAMLARYSLDVLDSGAVPLAHGDAVADINAAFTDLEGVTSVAASASRRWFTVHTDANQAMVAADRLTEQSAVVATAYLRAGEAIDYSYLIWQGSGDNTGLSVDRAAVEIHNGTRVAAATGVADTLTGVTFSGNMMRAYLDNNGGTTTVTGYTAILFWSS